MSKYVKGDKDIILYDIIRMEWIQSVIDIY